MAHMNGVVVRPGQEGTIDVPELSEYKQHLPTQRVRVQSVFKSGWATIIKLVAVDREEAAVPFQICLGDAVEAVKSPERVLLPGHFSEANVCKTCDPDCGCMEIDGVEATDSVMWTHESVNVKVLHDYEVIPGEPGDHCDLRLSCGSTIGYVAVSELPEEKRPRKFQKGESEVTLQGGKAPLFLRNWFNVYEGPTDPEWRRVRAWNYEDGSWFGVRAAVDDGGTIYVEDVRIAYVQGIREVYFEDRRVPVLVRRWPGSGEFGAVETALADIDYKLIKPAQDSLDRARIVAQLARVGKVCLLPETSNQWHQHFWAQVEEYPHGPHDRVVRSFVDACLHLTTCQAAPAFLGQEGAREQKFETGALVRHRASGETAVVVRAMDQHCELSYGFHSHQKSFDHRNALDVVGPPPPCGPGYKCGQVVCHRASGERAVVTKDKSEPTWGGDYVISLGFRDEDLIVPEYLLEDAKG